MRDMLVTPRIAQAQAQTCPAAKYSDSHFHLTNYIQEGIRLEDYLKMMGTAVCRSTVFGIPLQQMWQYGNTGDFAPTYYLQTDAPLYYYSFTDAARTGPIDRFVGLIDVGIWEAHFSARTAARACIPLCGLPRRAACGLPRCAGRG